MTAYASSHPWEDWAETWAHYLHIMDTLETAASFGISVHPQGATPNGHEFSRVAYDRHMNFSALMTEWTPLTCALNSINRSMGLADLYPFIISPAVVEKLRFIHTVINEAGQPAQNGVHREIGPGTPAGNFPIQIMKAPDITEPAGRDEPMPATPEPVAAREKISAMTVALISMTVMAGIAFAYFAWPVVLPFTLALVAAMTLKPPVTWLRRHRVPAALAALAVLGFFILILGAVMLWLGQPAVDWAKSAPEQLPKLQQKFKSVLQPVARLSAVASNMGNLEATPASTNAPPVAVKEGNHMVGAMVTWTRSLLAGITEAIVLTFLFLAAGDSFRQKMVHAIAGRDRKKRASEISQEIQHNISRYLFTVSLINTGLGCLTGLGFWLVGLPNAAMWGGVAAILNFLPFFGPILGMVIVGLAGLLAFNTVGMAVAPVAVYAVLHLSESYFITPYALGQRFSLNPVAIFVAFIFFAWLWGVFGALLAVPLLVSFKVICERVPKLTPFSEFLAP